MSRDAWLGWYGDRRVEPGVTAFAKLLKEAGAATVLDFGCGTGRHTVYLSRLGFHLYGFDWSEASIRATKKDLLKEGLVAELSVWDMNQTPIPYDDAYFDAVLAVRVFHHGFSEQVRNSTSEIGRVTKKGGFLYVEVPTFRRLLGERQKGVEFDEPEPGTYVPSSGDEKGVPHHYFRKDELVSLFGQFKPEHVEEKQDHLCLTAVKR